MAENEQIISIDRQDSLRKELEAKLSAEIAKLDGKIENRITNQIFFGVLGILAVIIVSVLTYAVSQINITSGKMEELGKHIAVIETKIEVRETSKR